MRSLIFWDFKPQCRARRHGHNIEAIKRTCFAAFTNLDINLPFTCGLLFNNEHARLGVFPLKQRAHLYGAAFFTFISFGSKRFFANY